jgi:mono/diheme cytochrome c family protein
MKRNALVCAFVLILPALSAAQDAKPAPVPRAKAVELYEANCQVCHGPGGAGTPLTKDLSFVGRKWKHGKRQQDVVKTITEGVTGTPMLPFKGRLSPAEISALASLVRSYDRPLKPGRH